MHYIHTKDVCTHNIQKLNLKLPFEFVKISYSFFHGKLLFLCSWQLYILYSFCLPGNTALTYACAGGFVDVVKVLLKEGANIEDHNENGHTPLMEAASAGHVEVARVLLEYGAGINTHSNEFKESALTLACYKGQSSNIVFLLLINILVRHN